MFIPFFSATNSTNVSCYYNSSSGEINLTNSPNFDPLAHAWGEWKNSLNDTGWYQFYVSGNSSLNSTEVAICAGAIEGYTHRDAVTLQINLVYDIFGWNRTSVLNPKSNASPHVISFLQQNLNFIREAVNDFPEEPYWQRIKILLAQFDGFVFGYFYSNYSSKYQLLDLWIYQSEGDSFEIPSTSSSGGSNSFDHCTGIIRLLPDFSDLYFSHSTWCDYRELHGELKEYNLNIKEFKAKTVVFSTRVGKLGSIDDFYINDQGLLIFETTITNFNLSLAPLIVPQSVLCWMRAMYAAWMSSSGSEWKDSFGVHNSGTYNNQYCIINGNIFKDKPKKDLLWVVEQTPGMIFAKDMTEFLINNGFWASFNVPFFPEAYERLDRQRVVDSLGPLGYLFSYKDSPRRLILTRETPNVFSFQDFFKLSRYNNYKSDPIGRGDPCSFPSGRCDLRSGIFPYELHGAVDCKAAKLSEALTSLGFLAIGSPEYERDGYFNFNTTKESVQHDGLIDEWKFENISFVPRFSNKCQKLSTQEKCVDFTGCGWCIPSQQCFSGDSKGPFYNLTCEDGWKFHTKLQSWVYPLVITVSVLVVLFVVSVFLMNFLKSRS